MVQSVKNKMLKKNKLARGTLDTRLEDAVIYENAFKAALSAPNVRNINVRKFLKELSKEQLLEIEKQLKKGSFTDSKIYFFMWLHERNANFKRCRR